MILEPDNSPRLTTPPLPGVRRRKRGPAPRPAKDIQAQDLHGFKKLQRVAELLAHLHLVGCDRDKAHNRELHFDDYVLLMLLAPPP
ncbi:MAG TPA: hypothetical protein VHX86_14170 [Tepidisphaeraceae bacterium]|nr:hypothetical protein [Tepidisphaeraceae bacterium]